ncbi:MAG: dihydropteroate synthase [Saprospiraceae bacterium]|nr:dihydropteroate synthase [Saprospiraceae bacterium]
MVNHLPIRELINCGGKLIDLSEPRIMAIMNVTPDSFFQGSRLDSEQAILEKAGKSLEEGASFLDIGGVSTRPGASEVSLTEELDRVLPAITLIKNNFPEAIISIDSWRAEVVKAAVIAGASMVNDISGGKFDSQMWETVGALDVPYIFMHTSGKPNEMQRNTDYKNVSLDICDFFGANIQTLLDHGIKDIILDPGFGFGKTIQQNYQLLHDLPGFRILQCPLLVGLSRKSMIHKVLEISPHEALNGTTAVHMISLLNGASILRVHDVKEANECIRVFSTYHKTNKVSTND